MLDVGAGVGGPAAYAAGRTGVRPVLAEPEPGACRAAARLFARARRPGRRDGPALRDRLGRHRRGAWACCAPRPARTPSWPCCASCAAWCAPGGPIGLLVYLAETPELDDPPQGNHFPARAGLHALLGRAGLDVEAVADAQQLPDPPAGWADRTAAVERELRRRFGSTPQLAAAAEQSDRIGKLLSSGQLTSQVLLLRRKVRDVS